MLRLIRVLSLAILIASSVAQRSSPSDLTALEDHVFKEFNRLRSKGSLKPLKVRRDLRVRMEACSIQARGTDRLVEARSEKRKSSYITADPKEPNPELTRVANIVTNRDHVAVGVWFAKTQEYPSGMYWVLIYPEHSAAHEAFWKHFYLTDDFEYATAFDKHWERALPPQCRAVR